MLKTLYYKTLPSTQTYIKDLLKTSEHKPPFAVVADIQFNGIGSRGNSWTGIDGNLFLSFAICLDDLPKDLKLESASIYFSYILKITLADYGSKVWLKWPNDFYINDKKIGGMITNIVGNTLVCGVGLNLKDAPNLFDKLDIEISRDLLLKKYFENIEKNLLWKQVFSKFKLEFYRNQNFFTHINNKMVSLAEAVLENDGSLSINGERIYSLR